MKYLTLPIMLLLSGCSTTCSIPYGEYEAFGGNESATKLTLNAEGYQFIRDDWSPTGYKERSHFTEQGKWSCKGGIAEMTSKSGNVVFELKMIGDNPLALAETTKALVFNVSSNDVLSEVILYPSESLKDGLDK